jgi:DNA-binding transcriptional ArsR family regulator
MNRDDGAIPPLLSLDRMVHEPARLAILTALFAAEEVEFLFLQKVTTLSKGNLSSHAQKLEAAGYLKTTKVFRGRIPLTTFCITKSGRAALESYQKQMQLFTERKLRSDPVDRNRTKAQHGAG